MTEQEQKRQIYTEMQRLISVGAYSERSAEHFATGTYPEDGVEETVDSLQTWARRQGLEFAWNPFTQAFDLQRISQEDLDAMEEQEQEDTQKYMEHFYEGGEG